MKEDKNLRISKRLLELDLQVLRDYQERKRAYCEEHKIPDHLRNYTLEWNDLLGSSNINVVIRSCKESIRKLTNELGFSEAASK